MKKLLALLLSLSLTLGVLPVLNASATDAVSPMASFNEAGCTVLAATDSKLVTVGRTMTVNGLPAFSGGASGFITTFTGTSLYVDFANGSTNLNLAFLIDSTDGSKAKRVQTAGNKGWYCVASGLADTKHTVRVVNRDTGGWFSFDKLATDGSFQAAPALTGPVIEVYGDSITEGACTFDGIFSETYAGYASEAGYLLNADMRIASISGGGITENAAGNCTFWDTQNPRNYYRTFNVSTPALGAYTRSAPDAIVINVGTNDNNHIHDDANYTLDDYVNTYLSWLDEIHTDFPDAKVVCVLGSIRDDRPDIDTMLSRLQTDVVAEANRRAGETYVTFMEQVNCNGYEELGRAWDNLHPDYHTQQYFGLQLARYLNDLLGLGQTLDTLPALTAKPPKYVINEDDIAQIHGVAFTSSSNYNTTKPASAAFDGDNYSYWQANSDEAKAAGEAWVSVEFDNVYTVTSAFVDWNTICASGTSKIEVSTDGTNWTTAAQFTATEDEDLIAFASPVQAKFLRLHLYGSSSNKGYWPEVLTVSAFGEAAATVKGDADGDGLVNASDLTALARHVGGIETITDATLLKNAELDSDTLVGSSDLTKLARFVAKIVEAL